VYLYRFFCVLFVSLCWLYNKHVLLSLHVPKYPVNCNELHYLVIIEQVTTKLLLKSHFSSTRQRQYANNRAPKVSSNRLT